MRSPNLWRNASFVHLWGAATISTFGSLVTRTALPFTAILLLHASAADLGALRVAELLPAFLVGLVAGAWVDRVQRRPIMVATDLGRALLLATIPVAALAGWLGFGQLIVVAALVSVLSVFFDVAYQSYLPAVVTRERLLEANSKVSAAMSVAETSAFSAGGWLVQVLTAPIAILVDAVSFVASALLVARIRAPESLSAASDAAPSSLVGEVRDGLGAIWGQPVLRGMVLPGIAQNLAFGLLGTIYLLYVNQEVGFDPGVLGFIFGVGGISAFAGALIAGRLPRFGVGAVMVVALLMAAIGEAFVPLATTANAAGVALLVGQQIVADGALTVYDINLTSLRQAVAPAQVLGRVNASIRVVEFGAILVGTVGAAYLGEAIGLRSTLWLGVACTLIAGGALALSPVREVDRIPETPLEVTA